MKSIELPNKQKLFYEGPDLSEGAFPSIFYFALSAKESLTVDPFNQPVMRLLQSNVRVFSLDIPAHGEDMLATEALKIWAKDVENGIDPITPFLNKTAESLELLKNDGLLSDEKTAVMGLSRGAFVATEIASRLSWVKTILGFAPLTQLRTAKEFQPLLHSDIVQELNLNRLVPKLLDKKLRFYISNRDTRVGTKECYEFIENLSLQAHEAKIRSPQIELFIKPPIGHQGHGTPKETFEEGAKWILKSWEIL